MGSGDSPGLQNRRAAGSLSLVGSTPTRFRHVRVPSLRSGFCLRAPASLTPANRLNFKTGGRQVPCRWWVRLPLASAIVGFLRYAQDFACGLPLSLTPANRLNFKTGGRQVPCRWWVRLPLASAMFGFLRCAQDFACGLPLSLTPANRLNFKTGGRQVPCRWWVRLPLASAIVGFRSHSPILLGQICAHPFAKSAKGWGTLE
jgi:hypothetical protein